MTVNQQSEIQTATKEIAKLRAEMSRLGEEGAELIRTKEIIAKLQTELSSAKEEAAKWEKETEVAKQQLADERTKWTVDERFLKLQQQEREFQVFQMNQCMYSRHVM